MYDRHRGGEKTREDQERQGQRVQLQVQPDNPSKSEHNLWQRQKVCYDLSHISFDASTFNLFRLLRLDG